MSRAPDPEALIGPSLPGSRGDRLRRVHDALVRAGPLPDLPASLRQPPQIDVRAPRVDRKRTSPLPRVAAAAAAFLLAGAASSTYALTDSAQTRRGTLAMHATPAAPDARGVLTVGTRDHAGNVSITLHVRGLPSLPAGSVYEMYLTDKSRVVGACGVFRTDGGATVVHFNVPYELGEYSGWVITRKELRRSLAVPLLTTS